MYYSLVIPFEQLSFLFQDNECNPNLGKKSFSCVYSPWLATVEVAHVTYSTSLSNAVHFCHHLFLLRV